MKPISEQLASARRARGYTQEQFAEMLHVSRQAVSHWENGRATPDLEMLREIARLLEQPALLTPDEPLPPAAPDAPRFPALRRLLPAASVLTALLIVLALSWSMLRDKPRAEVTITPESPVAYRLRNSDIIWDVMFFCENTSDVPFRPECLIASFYTNDQPGESLVLLAEQLEPFMGGRTLRREYEPLRIPIGSDRPYYTRIVCTLYGTDENGHLLRFAGSCELKYEYPPEAP